MAIAVCSSALTELGTGMMRPGTWRGPGLPLIWLIKFCSIGPSGIPMMLGGPGAGSLMAVVLREITARLQRSNRLPGFGVVSVRFVWFARIDSVRPERGYLS